MKIFKTLVYFTDVSDGSIYKVDTIEHEGRMWLVPEWLESLALGSKTPARIICLDTLPHQKTEGGMGVDFVLNGGIPKSVFDGQNQQQSGFEVIEMPLIQAPTQKREFH